MAFAGSTLNACVDPRSYEDLSSHIYTQHQTHQGAGRTARHGAFQRRSGCVPQRRDQDRHPAAHRLDRQAPRNVPGAELEGGRLRAPPQRRDCPTSKKTIIITSAAIVAAAALTVGGFAIACAFTPAADEKAAPVIPTSIPSNLVEKPAESAKPMSEFEKELAAKNAVRDYTLANGSVVKVDPNAPVPAEVVADIQASAAAPIGGLNSSNPADASSNDAYTAMDQFLAAKADAVGRPVIMVGYATYRGSSSWLATASNMRNAPFNGTESKDEQIADAQGWAEKRNGLLIVIG